MNKGLFVLSSLGAVLLMLCLPACGAAETRAEAAQPVRAAEAENVPAAVNENGGEAAMQKTLRLYIDDTEVMVDWEENDSVAALRDLASATSLSVQMSMYGGFEQVGPLGTGLPRNDVQTTTQAGDIVLYSGSQIVVFYGSNTWAYTRLGHITDASAGDLTELLANGDVVITLSLEQGKET